VGTVCRPWLPGQPSFDQTKGWGTFHKLRSLRVPSHSSGKQWRTRQWRARQRHRPCPLRRAGMPFMMIAFRPLEFAVTPDTTYIIMADFDALRRVFTDDAIGPVRSSRRSPAIQSENGSTLTATASSTCLRLKRGLSRDPAFTTSAGCRCIATTSPSSKSASIWIRQSQPSARRDHSDR